jgi:hypothetical protein
MAGEEIKATPESYVAEFYKAAVEPFNSHLNPCPLMCFHHGSSSQLPYKIKKSYLYLFF